MKEIYTLMIELVQCMMPRAEAWKRSIEITADTSLDDLHLFIQEVIGFDNDHLYAFYTAKTLYGQRARSFSLTFDDDIFASAKDEQPDTPLAQVFPLPKGHFLFYLFDYGDDWRFRIRKTNRKTQFATEGVIYPRVVSGVGENPEQYPAWDDDDPDDEE